MSLIQKVATSLYQERYANLLPKYKCKVLKAVIAILEDSNG